MLLKKDVIKIISDIKYKDWELFLGDMADGWYLQVRFVDKDIHTGELEQQSCRKFYISSHSIPDEVIRTAYRAVMAAVRHEAEETFTYKGKNIFGPHLSVERLVEIADDRNFREDKRKQSMGEMIREELNRG